MTKQQENEVINVFTEVANTLSTLRAKYGVIVPINRLANGIAYYRLRHILRLIGYSTK